MSLKLLLKSKNLNLISRLNIQDNKENVPGNLQKEIKQRIKHKHILRSSKSKHLIKKKEYSERDEIGALNTIHRRGSSDASARKQNKFTHKRTESSDTSYLLSSMKKHNHSNTTSGEKEFNKSSCSSDGKSTQKMDQPDEEMYHTLLAKHNNYDLKPYFTDATSNHIEQEERMQVPVVVNDCSPLILTKGKAKNQAFSNFQKQLSSQLSLKPRGNGGNVNKRLRLGEANQSVDLNPMTVESSVKSVIFKDTPSHTVPSSFVEADYYSKSKKPPIPSEAQKQYHQIYQTQNSKIVEQKQRMSLYDVSASGTFVQK